MIVINKQIRVFILVLLSIFFNIHISNGQISKNYIYAKVITKDSSSFLGLVKFNKKLFMWSDFLKLNKLDNPYSRYIPKKKLIVSNRLVEIGDGDFKRLDKNLNYLKNHSFSVRFGFIKAIDFIDNNYLLLEIKNKKFIKLSYNSFFSDFDIEIKDREFGEINIDASIIHRIEFMKTPDDIVISKSKPIYGTVQTQQGKFTGFIRWDMDEVLEDDLIDGNWKNKEISIAFKSIHSIKRHNDGCIVKTLSGRELYLRHSNDISYGNRGLEVNMPNVGKVKISWKDFKSLNLNHAITTEGIGYAGYGAAKRLSGKVFLKDSSVYSGIIVYDLDEAMSVENINGKNSNLRFSIPFMYIKSISPMGFKYSKVRLKNGTELLLGGENDVNYKNDGVLVFTKSGNYEFFHWFEIKNIKFD